MLYGSFEYTIDAKNRVFIPAKYKEEMGVVVKLSLDLFEKCIKVYSLEEWEKYENKLNKLPSIQYQDFRRAVYAHTSEVQIDSQGRVIIPPTILKASDIEKDVIIIGAGDHAEIWSNTKYNEKENNIDLETIRQSMIDMQF